MTEEIQRYDHTRKILTKSQQYKIRKLVEHKCIKRTGPDTWLCLPIQGYNSTTYKITRDVAGIHCNCQFYVMNSSITGGTKDCAHIGAMILAGGLTMTYPAEEKQLTF